MSADPQPRAVDRDLLIAIRRLGAASVPSLVDVLGVTATAVRQRIDRSSSAGWIERQKVVSGRGRPTFEYRLTMEGQKAAGARTSDLLDALWHEVMAIEDAELRERILDRVGRRLGSQYASELSQHQAIDQKIRDLSAAMSSRNVIIEVDQGDSGGGLPVLDIGVCPYPSLSEADAERSMCRLEEQMFSEALGQPVQLSSCRLDGDDCCQFTTVTGGTTDANRAAPTPSNSSDRSDDSNDR